MFDSSDPRTWRSQLTNSGFAKRFPNISKHLTTTTTFLSTLSSSPTTRTLARFFHFYSRSCSRTTTPKRKKTRSPQTPSMCFSAEECLSLRTNLGCSPSSSRCKDRCSREQETKSSFLRILMQSGFLTVNPRKPRVPTKSCRDWLTKGEVRLETDMLQDLRCRKVWTRALGSEAKKCWSRKNLTISTKWRMQAITRVRAESIKSQLWQLSKNLLSQLQMWTERELAVPKLAEK